MDEDRKSEILAALAARHGVDKESPAVAEEWQLWSGENQHLVGASVGDAVRSFVSHLTKRGVISTTTASTEARAPSTEAHQRHVTNAAIAGADYGDDDDDDADDGGDEYDGGADMAGRHPLDAGEVGEDLESLLAPASLDDFALEDHVTLDEKMRGASPLRSGGELLGGDGDDDPDYEEHGGLGLAGDGVPATSADEDIDAIMREIYDLDLDAAGAEFGGGEDELEEDELEGLGEELGGLELAGRRPRFLNRSRFIAHTRMSAKLSMLVNFAARHRVVDPESEHGLDTLEKMHSQGMDVGSDIARTVARYIARRPGTDTDRQKDHLRALPATLVVHWIAALGWIDSRTWGEVEQALRYLRGTLADFRSQIFQTPEMERQYAQRTTLGGGPTQIVNAPFENTRQALGRGATALGKGATALGGGVLYGTKKAYTGTVRGARKLKSMGRAGLNSKQRASVAALVLAFVQQGKIAAGAIQGHGSARRVDEHVRASALLLKTNARGRAAGTATSLIEMLVGLVHGYVTDERFAMHQVRLVDDALAAIDAAAHKYQLALSEGSAEGALSPAGASILLETTHYDREGKVISRTDHGEFATRLVGAAAAYLRQNPSCVKKAGAEFALLVPADPQTVRAVSEKLASEDANERKRYLQNALLARHPNAELDAGGHLLSLSGRPYRSQSAAGGATPPTLQLQRMRRQASAPKHEDVWDTELRNAGGSLTPHANHRPMHCAAPKTAGAGVFTVHASAHPDSQAIRIRPLHFRVASQ